MKLKLNEIQFRYGSKDVLKKVSLSVESGEILSLVGPNEYMIQVKLLYLIDGIISAIDGTILLDGRNIEKIEARKLARSLGYVPQSVPASFPLTVFDTILLGRKPHILWKTGKSDREIVFKAIKLAGLEEMAFRIFNELSGGEKQRVLVARAFAQEPEVLLLDEPISNLDLKYQFEILELITQKAKDNDLAVVMAIHDLNLASKFSDKTMMLKEGIIFAAGKTHTTLNKDNIREVYGIEVAVNTYSGRSYIIPLDSA